MSSLDAILIVLTLAYAVATVAAPRVAMFALPVVAPLLFFGWALQLLSERFYWQFLPLYLLFPLSAALAVVLGIRPRTGARPVAARVAVAVLAVISLPALAPVPVPRLPEPTGSYAVGSQIFRWVDEQRAEPANPAERRNVVVQAWYPSEGSSGRQYVYIDGEGELPAGVSGMPGPLMRGYESIDTHAFAEVDVSDDRQRWPVVLFSPGYRAPRAFYTELVTDLASRGFVVLAVDHPYDSAVTELADGRIVTTEPDPPSSADAEAEAAMAERQHTRAADLRFVIDQLARPDLLGSLADRMDTDHIAAVGHSLGGASALAAFADDPRIAAAVDIDGTLYADLPERTLTRPVLLLESDHDRTDHPQLYLDSTNTLLGNLAAPGYRYELGGTDHFGFTDAPFFLARPARWALAGFPGGPRDPADTQRTTNALIEAFLREPLGDPPADLAATAAAHADVTGGPI